MKKIPLTQGQVALVDDADFERFGKMNWCVNPRKSGGFYATRRVNRKTSYMHREIMGVTDRLMVVDHKNHDTLDNRRKNLRVCTNSQNAMNKSGAKSNSKSGIRGVCWSEKYKKWLPQISINGKQTNLGCFDRKEDAIAAYAAANKKHYGEFGGIYGE